MFDTPMWLSEDGRVWRVDEMATPYIENIIALILNRRMGAARLNRNRQYNGKEWLEIFSHELERREGTDREVEKA